MARRRSLFDGPSLNAKARFLRDSKAHDGVREALEQAWQSFPAPDENFVDEFQGSGFDARVWELYLLLAFREAGCDVDRVPLGLDFRVHKSGITFHVEAAIASHGRGFKAPNADETATHSAYRGFVAGKFASVVHNKRKKRYERRAPLRGEPLVLAIAPFFGVSSHGVSESALMPVLWGADFDPADTTSKPLPEVLARPVSTIRRESKVIRAGLFSQPDMQHWSGVLYSSEGTVSKFIRRVAQEKHIPYHRVFRAGFFHDHDELATMPRRFAYEVGYDGPYESWVQGLSFSHNPFASKPLPRALLSGVADHVFSEFRTMSIVPSLHPYGTRTLVVRSDGLWMPWSFEKILETTTIAHQEALFMESKELDD